MPKDSPDRIVEPVEEGLVRAILVEELFTRAPDLDDKTLANCGQVAGKFLAEHPELLQAEDIDHAVGDLLADLVALACRSVPEVEWRDEPWPLYGP